MTNFDIFLQIILVFLNLRFYQCLRIKRISFFFDGGNPGFVQRFFLFEQLNDVFKLFGRKVNRAIHSNFLGPVLDIADYFGIQIFLFLKVFDLRIEMPVFFFKPLDF